MLQRERRAGQEESSRRTPAVRTKPPRASTGSAPASTARRSSSARTSRMFRGLVKYPSIPASRHRSRSPFMALAVRAMTGSRAAPVMPHAAGSRRWPPARPCGALHVHEHEVERMVREHRHRLAPVAGHEHLVPDLLDQAPHEQLVDDVVLATRIPSRRRSCRGGSMTRELGACSGSWPRASRIASSSPEGEIGLMR